MMLKRCLSLIALVWLVSSASGCASLSMTPHEHREQIRRVAIIDHLALQEDLDLLMQTERTTRLTRWYTR